MSAVALPVHSHLIASESSFWGQGESSASLSVSADLLVEAPSVERIFIRNYDSASADTSVEAQALLTTGNSVADAVAAENPLSWVPQGARLRLLPLKRRLPPVVSEADADILIDDDFPYRLLPHRPGNTISLLRVGRASPPVIDAEE